MYININVLTFLAPKHRILFQNVGFNLDLENISINYNITMYYVH